MAVLDELKKYNFNFSKKFGQNFIFDTNLLVSIVSSANLPDNAQVLEIGTGAGTLTKIIADKASKVISFEIDPNLREYLTDKFADTPNVDLVFQDVLSVATDKIDDMFDGQYHMIANLPYYITTPIIFKFLEESKKLKTLTIMVQQEVADRLIAKENTADYGAITASIGTIGEAKIVKRINRKMFTPAPNVDSAIVQITIDRNKYKIDDIKTLRATIKSAFAMRRKTLSNNLKASFGLSTDAINEILTEIDLPTSVRGEVLSPAKFVELSNAIFARKTQSNQ